MIQPLIHIGLHKTGTTWMQRRLFVDREIGFEMPWPRGREYAALLFVNAPPFSFDPETTRQAFAAGMRQCAEQGLVPVISHENLSGRPVEGIYDGKAIADRLHQTFPDGRILISIREQRGMMKSLYRQYVRQDGMGGPQDFFEQADYGQKFFHRCRLHHLEYHHIIAYYQKLFSPRQVLALPQEMLRADAVEFARRVCAHVGMELKKEPSTEQENVGMRGGALDAVRRLNRWLPARFHQRRDALERWIIRRGRFFDWLLRGGALEQRLTNYIQTYAAGRFCESNRITAELTGLDLSQYGYM